MMHIGIDGCRAGWFFVREQQGSLDFGVAPTIDDLMRTVSIPATVFIDIPIGLHEHNGEPRGCDTAARKLLGWRRSSSVFPAPIRDVLSAANYADANAMSKTLAGKGLSRQAFGLIPKIREVDDWLANRRDRRMTLREVHPELSFCALNGGVAMAHSKKTADGLVERMTLLGTRLSQAQSVVDGAMARYLRKHVACDDIVDALVVLVTAMTPSDRLATAPASPLIDPTGLAMEIVYPVVDYSGAQKTAL